MYRSRWLWFAMLGALGLLVTLFIYSCSALFAPVTVQPLSPPASHPTTSPINGFVTSTTGNISFLQWKQGDDGVLSGTLTIDYANGQHHQEHISGSIKGPMFTLSTSLGAMSGTKQQQLLHIQATPTGNMTTWYGVSSSDYQHIVTDFRNYLQVGKDQKQLLAVMQAPPDNSNPDYFNTQLRNAGMYVAGEQNSFQQIQLANSANQCVLVQTFQTTYPATQDPAHMPFSQTHDSSFQAIVDRSSLSQSIATLQNHWNVAHSITLPKLPASTFPWIIDPTTNLRHAQLRLEDLQQVVLTDGKSFLLLEKQHQYLQRQVQQKVTTCSNVQA